MPGQTSSDRQDAFHHEIKEPHAAIIQERVAGRKGVIVEGTGDGFFIAFGDAELAVLCGVEIQENLAKAKIDTPHGQLQIRIGLHTGQAQPNQTGYTAGAADKAARVQSAAEPGHVYLSRRTAELVRDEVAEISLQSAGAHSLKGLAKEELFRVGRPDKLGTVPARPVAASSERAGPLRVLVAGSLCASKAKGERNSFKTVCRLLGAALAQRAVAIVVSSLHEATADVRVLEGADNSRNGMSRLPVVLLPPTLPRPNDPLWPGNDEEFAAIYPNLQPSIEMLRGNWKQVRETQVQEVDVVIVIGGREGVSQLGWAAKRHGVPLLPIPIYGRAAKQLWEVERAEYAATKRFDEAEAFDKLYKKFKADEVVDLALLLAANRKPS